MVILLNLGCGRKKLEDHINVDFESIEGPDVVCDLGREVWPWPDNSVDGATASHLLEHLPGDTFVHFLQQLYRVCKNGALVNLVLPHPRHDIFLNDPTHVRPVMPATILLLSPRYVKLMEKSGLFLTDFGTRWGVNFELDPKILYKFDPTIDTKLTQPTELEWMAKHYSNIILEWLGTMKVVK